MSGSARAEPWVVELGSEAETERLGRAIASVAGPGTVIGLVGSLGAGKTRLSRAIAEALGVDPGAISSPTFVLMQEYEGWMPVFHMDTYRLQDVNAFDALGPEEYWDAGGISLVEWADRFSDRLPDEAWWVELERVGETSRRAVVRVPEKSTRERLTRSWSDQATAD